MQPCVFFSDAPAAAIFRHGVPVSSRRVRTPSSTALFAELLQYYYCYYFYCGRVARTCILLFCVKTSGFFPKKIKKRLPLVSPAGGHRTACDIPKRYRSTDRRRGNPPYDYSVRRSVRRRPDGSRMARKRPGTRELPTDCGRRLSNKQRAYSSAIVVRKYDRLAA